MSKLRGVKPADVEKRLKVLFYGKSGAGKTMTSLEFPAPYIIDTEKGAQNKRYKKALEKSGGLKFETNDFEEIINEIMALLTEKHPFKTLVIDSLSNVYRYLVQKAEEKYGTKYSVHYTAAGRQIIRLCHLLERLDMNVIVICHAKDEWDNESITGQTFDCYRNLDYLFDLIIEVQKRGKGEKSRFGVVRKTRLDECFAEGESFEFSYDSFAEKYGREILEKDVIPEKLAEEEKINELKSLIQILQVPKEVVDRWLQKSYSETIEEMPENVVLKCIEFLQTKMSGEMKCEPILRPMMN